MFRTFPNNWLGWLGLGGIGVVIATLGVATVLNYYFGESWRGYAAWPMS